MKVNVPNKLRKLLDFPSYAAIIKKRQELWDKKAANTKRIAELVANDERTAPTHNEAAAIALLDGAAATATSSRQSEFAELEADNNAIDAALRILEGRRREERAKCAKLICEEIKPYHNSLVAEVLAALESATAKHGQLNTLYRDLDEDDAAHSGTIRNMLFLPATLGGHEGLAWHVEQYRKEAAEYGMIHA